MYLTKYNAPLLQICILLPFNKSGPEAAEWRLAHDMSTTENEKKKNSLSHNKCMSLAMFTNENEITDFHINQLDQNLGNRVN